MSDNPFLHVGPGQDVALDLETTSLRDDEAAFYPWKGHAIAGFAIATSGVDATYLPVRHHDGEGSLQPGNLDHAQVCAYIQDIVGDPSRTILGANIKFDLRFLLNEGFDVRCKVADTAALGRLVNNDEFSYSLDNMAKRYGIGEKTGADLNRWLAAARSKDYGRLPVRLMTPYAKNDARLTLLLRDRLLTLLPAETVPLWENEKAFTMILAQAEHDGVLVDATKLKTDRLAILRKMMELNDAINAIAGWEVDPASRKHRNELLIGQLGYKPQRFTDTHQPKWDREVLEHLIIPDAAGPAAKSIGNLFRDWSYLAHFEGTYLDGWQSRLDANGLLHCDWRQYGTRTGRLSCSDPNLQSIEKPARRYLIPPDGYVLVGFDYSQIEYRLFGFYTSDPTIVGAYRADPATDFHAMTASRLGVPRAFGKTINFGVIYGMGEEKMIRSLMKAYEDAPSREDIAAAPAKYEGAAAREDILEALVRSAEAQGIHVGGLEDAITFAYNEYHRMIPSVRQFTRRVASVAKTRRWIRNLYGRHYQFLHTYEGTGKVAGLHKAVNYLIQGSAADMLRMKIVAAAPIAAKHGARFAMTVHDSVYYYVPRENASAFYLELAALLEEMPNVTLPIRVDGEIAVRSMLAGVEPEERTIEACEAALLKADETSDDAGSALLKIGRHIVSARGV